MKGAIMSLRFIGFLPHCYRVSATKITDWPQTICLFEVKLICTFYAIALAFNAVPFDIFLTPNSINHSPATHPLQVPRIPRRVHNMQVSPLALGQAASPFIATPFLLETAEWWESPPQWVRQRHAFAHTFGALTAPPIHTHATAIAKPRNNSRLRLPDMSMPPVRMGAYVSSTLSTNDEPKMMQEC